MVETAGVNHIRRQTRRPEDISAFADRLREGGSRGHPFEVYFEMQKPAHWRIESRN